jgi:cytochrome oxidase assembly protein ShyY1
MISSGFSEEIYSKVLVLDPNSKFSAKYIPIEPFAITPIKHYGYAVQWFAMSIVLLGMFLYALRRES